MIDLKLLTDLSVKEQRIDDVVVINKVLGRHAVIELPIDDHVYTRFWFIRKIVERFHS